MLKTPSPQIIPSNHNKKQKPLTSYNPSQHPQKSRSTLNYIKLVAKKVAGVFTFSFFRSKRADNKTATSYASSNLSQVKEVSLSRDVSTGSSGKRAYNSSSSTSEQVGVINFSVKEIYEATSNFSPANKIGEGGFGVVYKGKLRNGSLVAVKRTKQNTQQNRLFKEFKNEVLTLSQIEHLNLVRLFGYFEHGDERIVVVEYVENGTLREHLNGTRGNGLEIAERLDIAIDVAHAVTYLHCYTEPPIIHRDIKSSNILITEKLRAKVADFGFARLAAEDPDATHISTQVKGTAGYVDPDYVQTNQLTEKSDVYSFGVLLVEMMTGRLPIEHKRPVKERITIKWAMQKLKQGEAVIAMDLIIRRTPASIMAVEKVFKLAKQCLAPTRQLRPSMKQCAEELWKIRKDYQDNVSSSSATNASHRSENFLAKKTISDSSSRPKDPDNHKFASA